MYVWLHCFPPLIAKKVTSWDTDQMEEQESYEGGRSFINCVSEVLGPDSETCDGIAKNDMGECRMVSHVSAGGPGGGGLFTGSLKTNSALSGCVCLVASSSVGSGHQLQSAAPFGVLVLHGRNRSKRGLTRRFCSVLPRCSVHDEKPRQKEGGEKQADVMKMDTYWTYAR